MTRVHSCPRNCRDHLWFKIFIIEMQGKERKWKREEGREMEEKKILKSGDLAVVTAGVVNWESRHEPALHTNIMRIVNIL